MKIVYAILQAIPFVLAGLLILFGGHLFLYRSFVRFFGISSAGLKNILLAIFIFLSLSFIIASFWSRWQDNLVSRFFYLFSGLWLGLAIYLVFAALLVWLVIGFGKISGISLNIFALALTVFLAAGIYSGWGAWNAFHPVIKNVEVKIKNLPESWRGKTIVQISDLHLGLVQRPSFLRAIAKKVNQVEPDLILFTGDLFDGMGDNLPEFIGPFNILEAKQGIFFVTGNHETYLGIDKAFAILKETKIKILNDELVDLAGLQIIGLGYPKMNDKKSVAGVIKNLKDFDVKKPSILLYHAPFASDVTEAKNAGVSLYLAGHTHQGQLYPFSFITKLVYKGYDYGLRQESNFSIYTSAGAGTWGPAMRTGNRPEIVVIKLN
jgi:predicted MPP superfamily phosphohydrolase